MGTANDVYGAIGHETNIRQMIVWTVAVSLLIRKVVEECKPLPGQVSRTTTTLEPQANPKIDEDRFKFTPHRARSDCTCGKSVTLGHGRERGAVKES